MNYRYSELEISGARFPAGGIEVQPCHQRADCPRTHWDARTIMHKYLAEFEARVTRTFVQVEITVGA
ncbi:MAG: hypothetical protein K2Y05_04590 [Hyphomicrobiaceae bacterium]|nr:hypothetical protein [Hyphomicrobiaceae bacterium]